MEPVEIVSDLKDGEIVISIRFKDKGHALLAVLSVTEAVGAAIEYLYNKSGLSKVLLKDVITEVTHKTPEIRR